jgi:epoxyqueuosine reductase QueG
MKRIEAQVKEYAKSLGIGVIGLAGPERLDGPPSLDPTYSMRGAKSAICFALPMDVPAIYDFLSKKSPVPHNIDQLKLNQRMRHHAERIAEFLRARGHRARAVPSNNSYRRSLDPFATHPSFSLRFGAVVSGIAGQGLSGNVMTREYGAAVYLGAVVTDAVLESDPVLPPRFFMDNYCKKCQVCARACPCRMFVTDDEEQVLLGDDLHPRGRRRTIEFCNASCFGLHGLSFDKTWSSWGHHWIGRWVASEPDPEKENIRLHLLAKGSTVGDSTRRYRLIRNLGYKRYPEQWIDDRAILGRDAGDYRGDELDRRAAQAKDIERHIGIKLDDTNVLTCGQCALVCGPDMAESAKRLRMLREGGIVTRDGEGRTVVVKTFEEAAEMRRRYPFRVSSARKIADALASTFLWAGLYWGIEPKSIYQGWKYRRKVKRALAEEGMSSNGSAAVAAEK